YGATEILLEPIGDIGPERLDLLRRAAIGIDFHHGAAVDHRGGEIRTVVKRHWRDRAVLRERNRGFGGDLGLWRRAIDDEQQRLAGPLAQIDGSADRTEIVR